MFFMYCKNPKVLVMTSGNLVVFDRIPQVNKAWHSTVLVPCQTLFLLKNCFVICTYPIIYTSPVTVVTFHQVFYIFYSFEQ